MRILNILFLFLSLNLAAQEELSKDEISQFQKEMLTKTKDLLTLEADFIQLRKLQ